MTAKRLLFIAHRVPFPPNKGERVRAFHEIVQLARHFDVTVAALEHSRDDAQAARDLAAYCHRVITARAGGRLGLLRGGISLLAGRSVTEGYFANARLRAALRDAGNERPFDIVLGYSSSTLPYMLDVPGAARTMDLIDVDSAKWRSYADSAAWPLSMIYGREARGVRRLELDAARHCAAVALVSADEARAADLPDGKAMAIGNGVDVAYFCPRPRRPGAGPRFVFTGTMDYRPNVDAVCWFAREVWPLVRRDLPEAQFVVVGRDPAPTVQRLADIPGIEVTGSVPDVRPYFGDATAAVVPLRIARGVQNKVLEAMAAGRAVIGSPGALEGLSLALGSEAVQAGTPEQWARAMKRLAEDDAHRRSIEEAARAAVEQRFTWDAQLRPLVELCLGLAGMTPADAETQAATSGQ